VPAYRAKGARRGPSARGAAMLLASIGHGGRGPVATAVLIRQLTNTAKALHDAHLAAGQAREAAQLAAAVRDGLAAASSYLPTPAGAPSPAAGRTGGHSPSRMGSVVPADLERARTTTVSRGDEHGRG
jgi:hypothetical protein